MGDAEVLVSFVFATLLFVVVPLVFFLLHHQRKMAELMHGKAKHPLPQQMDAQLAHEISLLRQTLAQQAIAIDSLAESQRQLAESLKGETDVRQRLSS